MKSWKMSQTSIAPTTLSLLLARLIPRQVVDRVRAVSAGPAEEIAGVVADGGVAGHLAPAALRAPAKL